MIRIIATLVLLASPVWATQDQWPALHDVSGVSADDVLNIRAEPSASAPVIGTLAHDTTGIEVIEPNDRHTWGLVNTGEGIGWVSLAYLTRHPGQWYGSQIDRATCVGMEPFWTFAFSETDVTWNTPEGETSGQILDRFPAVGRPAEQGATFRLDNGDDGVAILRLDTCHDTMSDRAYGISVNIVAGGTEGPALYSGCCSLTP